MEALQNWFLGNLPWTFFGSLIGTAVLATLAISPLRREACQYLAAGIKELREIIGLGPLAVRGLLALWRLGRNAAIKRWPKLGRSSDLYIPVAALAVGVMASLAYYQAASLLRMPPQISQKSNQTWTTDADWNTWSLAGLEVENGSLHLTNEGGKGTWRQLKEKVTLSGGWQQLAASKTDLWLTDGGQDIVQVELEEERWTKHEDVVMANTTIGAVWAKDREAAVFGQNGSVRHWKDGRWIDEEPLSMKDGEHLKALCAYGESWTDLYVGAVGAIFHHTANGWSEEIQPGSRIGAFTGIAKDANGAIWATNDIGSAGSVWRKGNSGWRMVFEAPISWQGITTFDNRVVAFCKFGYLYEMERLKDGNVSGKAISQEIEIRGISGNLSVGRLKDGVNCRDMRTGRAIPGPSSDDLARVVQVNRTKAWAISGSAVYSYDTEPKYNNTGTADIVLWRNRALRHANAQLLADVPKCTTASVMYSNDGKAWTYDMANLPADDENPLVVCRLMLTSTENRSTPSVRALTIGPSPLQ